jgi:uncharacterized protein DUF5701
MADNGSNAELRREFDRQVDTLLARGYPRLAGLREEAFLEHVTPLAERLDELRPQGVDGRLPFAIVIRSELVASARAMELVELNGKRGFVGMFPTEPGDYGATDDTQAPGALGYLITDVDTGSDLLGVTPDDALEKIRRRRRSPLTIDEGIAVLTHYPDVLQTKNAFSILGSRKGDRRVPALWISGGKPRLGWCWAGNPHTWLGSASCGGRLGASSR